jgi:type I restriction enzyme M protein
MVIKSSEVHAYIHIKERLEELGWNVSNPERNAAGQVYTQHECLKNDLIKKYLVRDVPENVVVVRENRFMVLEAKSEHKDLDKAKKEVIGYADKMNVDKIICPIAVAIAGNPNDTFIIQNFFFQNGAWEEIVVNKKTTTGFLSPQIAQRILDAESNSIDDIQISDDILFNKAKKINEILHIGSINKNARAKVMASILLAMADERNAEINVDNDAFPLINEINAKAKAVLHKHNKGDFAESIAISTPPTPDNHVKFRRAIVDTIQELKDMNIRSAMNSGTDILGRFYEIFLKYGNGAKEIGIVLTPRHLTKFAVDAVRVSKTDKVFDPACGTGGFLVAAFDHVRKQCDEDELEDFKKSGIYGIEQEPEVVALALVNMIFRGDGKNNIQEGNCFADKHFKSVKMTKVLMNPPFALKKDDEKEYKFIDFALSKMSKGGLLFVIIPSPVMFREKGFKEWRKNMLRNHTLKAVIKLPEDLFYPVGVHTSGVIIETGRPHEVNDKVLWASMDDGFRKRKGVMISTSGGNMQDILGRVHTILDAHTFNSKPREWILSPIDQDKFLECAPEQYLEDILMTDADVAHGMRTVMINLLSSQLGSL